MGESRSELLAWINELLNLSYTKIEQMGSGFAYAQIIDSVYGNVPMSKLNASAKHEYEFINNFKILQAVFKRNKIDKPIPVDRLVKCKMQDNLEFTQWLRRWWDSNYPGTPYDPDARRAGVAAAPPPLIGAATVGAARPLARSSGPSSGSAAPAPRRPAATSTSGATARAAPAVSRQQQQQKQQQQQQQQTVSAEEIQALTEQMEDMNHNVTALEKERDFYFAKLRDIEVLINDRLSLYEPPEGEPQQTLPADQPHESEVLKQVQAILYSTEEGFELPEGQEEVLGDEEEIF